MIKDQSRDILSVIELADLLGIARSSAYKLASKIPSYKLPGVGVRFRRGDVDAWLESHRFAPPALPDPASGTPLASTPVDLDDEVLPGLTRRQLMRETRS